MNTVVKRLYVLAITIMLTLAAASLASAKAQSTPEFAASGRISGTDLTYSGLAVNKNGVLVVTISNPTGRGISFRANFVFYDSKGNLLDGISISGFAHKNSSTTHAESIDYGAVKKAKSVKVLGRAGRKVGDDD